MSDFAIERLSLPVVDENLCHRLKELTEPRWHCIFNNEHPYQMEDATLVALVATSQGKPIGIALGTVLLHIQTANLYTLYVHPDYRNQKVGSQLVHTICEHFLKETAEKVSVLYHTEDPSYEYFEKILKAERWYEPEIKVIRTTYDKYTFKPGWFGNPPEIPKDYELFKWKDLKGAERTRLQHQQQQKVFPDYLSPFREESLIEPINSLGMRHQGEVVGWVITHRIKPDTIRYTSLFFQRDLRNTGYPIRMVKEACMLQIAAGVPIAVMDINTSSVTPVWLRFMKTRMFPFAIAQSYLKQSWRELSKS